nr:glucose PTS transporter subunit IIA [Actinomyces sp.]
MATTTSSPEAILDAVGGPGNIAHLTHCATRLRFELNDASVVDTPTVEKIPGVMGAVPQSGNRYQIIIGGTVQSVYESIMALPAMKDAGARAGSAAQSNDEIKAAARASGIRGRLAWVDSFFEFLSDSFRPLIGALLGASIFITFMALMGTLGVIGNWADSRVTLEPTWAYLNLTWRAVFYFLPLMVAYNASKKLGADPWVGFAVMGFTMLPGFATLGQTDAARQITFLGSEITQVTLFGHLPLTIFDYNSQVFPPLLMAAVLGPLTTWLKKVVPADVQLIFVPFIAMLIMIPLTSFVLGPIGVYVGAGLSKVLLAINNISPFIFCLLIPLAYPFMVPLGLHWPINAVMLLNIQQNGFDFIQGPMGAWNFACFGATAGVLVLAVRHREKDMRVTATGALFAGLVGGISEPSLYGIHLRYKRIYPRLLVGCVVGGVIQGVFGGVTTNAFVFTSLLTIPAFSNIPVYAVSVLAAFFTAMVLVVISDYRTPEDRAEVDAVAAENEADAALEASRATAAEETAQTAAPHTGTAAPATAPAEPAAGLKAALVPGTVTELVAPLSGTVMAVEEVADPVFASGALGKGAGIDPAGDVVVTAPAAGTVVVAPSSGHAYGIALDNGVEILVHVGIDTVNLEGRGFDVRVSQGDRVEAGQELVRVDRALVEEAGYPLTTPVLVTNTAAFADVELIASGEVTSGAPLLRVTAKSE